MPDLVGGARLIEEPLHGLRIPHQLGAQHLDGGAPAHRDVFGFVDDVIILLTPRGAGTLVEARSASRIGRRDLGRNRSTLRELRDVLSRWA